MKPIYQKLWMLLIAASISLGVSAQTAVTVTATSGTTSQNYNTLADAFGAINAGTHTGAITIAINSSTIEPNGKADTLYSTGTLSASYTSVKVYPSTSGVTVSGNPGTGRGVVELFGADNVTIDGSVGGTGSDRSLTFVNTSTNTLAFTSVIRVCNSQVLGLNTCDNITIKNCVLNGNVTGTAGNNSTVTTTTTSAWTSSGINVGYVSNSSGTAYNNIIAATSFNQIMAQDGTFGGSASMTCSANNFVATNNQINLVGRGIQFAGNSTYAFVSCNSLTITNNIIGSSTPLSDYTTLPVVNGTYTNTVYAKGIVVSGANSILISGNTIQNMVSYLAGTMGAIDLNGSSGSGATIPMGTIVVSKNIIKNIYQNSNTTTSTNTAKGILINNANGSFYSSAPVAVDSNIITNIRCFNAGSVLGIDAPAVSNTNGGSSITRNVVSTVYGTYNTGTSSGNNVIGIRFTSGANMLCANNRVSDLLITGNVANFAVTSTSAGVFGIQNTGINNAKVYHNSVYLSGAYSNATTASRVSAAFCISTNTITGNDVRNNIFMNKLTGGTTSVAHVAIWLPAAAVTPSSMNLTLNNNAYYCGTTAASQGIAQFGTTANTTYFNGTSFSTFKTLAATFSSTGNNNSGSFADNSGTSPFTADLHTSPSGASQLESGGAFVSGVSTDIDGDSRPNGTAPDMGADEFSGTLLDLVAPSISYSAFSSVCDPSSTSSRTVSGVTITDATGVPTTGANMPRIYYKKGASSSFSYSNSAAGSLTSGNGNNGTWSFTIDYTALGLTNGDSVFYFVAAQDLVTTPNIATYPANGVLTDVNTLTTAPTTPFNFRAATLSGTYQVGTGFTGQGFSTLSAAIKAYNGSCLGGPVVFSLISSSYSTTSDTITANPSASATNTLTIKPTLANTVVTGNSGSINAVLLLMGADYVTVDGSISSTTNSICSPSTRASRDLTFVNTFSTSQNTGAVIWLCNTSAGDPATNNKIINCNATGTYNTSFSTVTQVGIGCAGPGAGGQLITTNGSSQNWGNSNINNQYINDSISNCGFGIYTAGASASNKNTGTVISQCVTGKAPNYVYRGGISANFEDGIVINGNTINPININPLGYPSAAFGISLGYGPGNTGLITSLTSGNDVTNAIVSKNIINGVYSTNPNNNYPATVGMLIATGSTGITTISNNIISDFNMGAAYGNATDLTSGLHIMGGASTVNVYNNTINIANTTSATASGFTGSEATYGVSIANILPIVNLKNNIINSSFAGYVNRNRAIGLGYDLPATNLTSNNNDLVVTAGSGANASTNAIAMAQTGGLSWGASGTGRTLHTTLGNWQANSGKDANSLNIVPVFVAANDLHISTASATNCPLRGAGATGLVSDDIDCASRTSNDIGADEFGAGVSIAATATTVCAGTSVTFTASTTNSASTSYQWKKNGNNVGTNSATYTDAALANNDVITCALTSAACNTTSNSITMTVNPVVTPSIFISTASTTVCSGSYVNFTATPTNGGTSPSYVWKKNGAGNLGSASSIQFAPGTLSTGDVISCVMTANNACQTTATANSNNIALVVNPSPAILPAYNRTTGVLLTAKTLCSVGESLPLVDYTAYGTWTSSNPSVATVTTVANTLNRAVDVVAQNSVGTTNITYTITSASGCSSSVIIPITVAPLAAPAAITAASSSVCVGSSLQLSNATPSGVWSIVGGRATVSNTGLALGTAAGATTAQYTITVGACSKSATYPLTVVALPAVPSIAYGINVVNPQTGAPAGSFCANRTINLVGVPTGGSWSSAGVLSVTNPGGVVSTGLVAGTGSVTYTYTASGCSNSRTINASVAVCAARGVNVSNEPLAMSNEFTMYPNPAKTVISLNVNTLVGAGSIVVTDLYGKTIKTQSLSMGTNTINVSNLSKGMYFVSMITNEGKTTKKLVVE